MTDVYDACCGTNPWVRPAIQPGPGCADAAWCIMPTNPCTFGPRNYADCDYIRITPDVKKTFVRMLNNRREQIQVNPARVAAYIEIRRKGCEPRLARYDAFQRTADGYVGFYWDPTFYELPPGFYVGDVFLDCVYCFSLQFVLPRCQTSVDSCYNETGPETCGEGECSMVPAIGDGVIGGLECITAPPVTDCGLPPPYFDSQDPVVPPEPGNCNLSCTPAFNIVADDLIGMNL